MRPNAYVLYFFVRATEAQLNTADSIIRTSFLISPSMFQYGIPVIGPCPGFFVSMPRIGARTCDQTAAGLEK